MKLPPSTYFSKLFPALLPELRRSTLSSRMLFGTLLAFSLLVSIYHFQVLEQPFFNNHDASAQLDTSPLFANPGSDDFLSYAVAIMPTVQGANLDTSNIVGSTNCDLLVPITYIDAGCMNSLPLLFPFEQQQPSVTEPTNQTVIYNSFGNGSALDLSIGVASDNITAGETQTVTVTVSDQNSTQPVQGALVLANVTDSFNTLLHEYSGTSDEVGQVSFPFVIPVDAASDVYNVDVLASADGYENASASTTFDVIGSGDFFDNSTSDNFFDDSSSSDSCCSDSSSSDNSDFTSPTVKSTDPSDGDNNVPTDLSEIKVTFDESIDKNSVDSGSLSLFTNSGFGTTPNVDSESVSGKTVTFKISQSSTSDRFTPGVTYIASISSSIQDQDGNFLDCFASNGVDDNCEWNFKVSGTSSSAITLSPTSGPVGTSVDITGTGFVPDSSVIITFDQIAKTTVTANSNGGFSATITVPILSLPGAHTIAANLASKTFTVTSSTAPAIVLNPTSGPVGTTVTVTGINFDPTTPVTLTFGGTTVTPTPNPVTPNSNGGFSATFTVPDPSPIGSKSVVATQGSKSASQTFTVTSSTAPAIVLDPTSGPVGTTVAVTGTNFDPSSIVTIYFEGNLVTTTPPAVTPASNGGFSATFTVPDPSPIGSQQVVATQGDSSASKPFTVTPPVTPTITLDPTSGPVGTTVTVAGTNFDPSAIVTIYFDGNLVTTTPPTVTPNSNGGFSATFKVPASSNGPYTVVANQGDNSPSATFTVTDLVTMTTQSHPSTSTSSINETNGHDSNNNDTQLITVRVFVIT